MYDEDTRVDPCRESCKAEKLNRASMLDSTSWMWFCCLPYAPGAEVRYGFWDCLAHDTVDLFAVCSSLSRLGRKEKQVSSWDGEEVEKVDIYIWNIYVWSYVQRVTGMITRSRR